MSCRHNIKTNKFKDIVSRAATSKAISFFLIMEEQEIWYPIPNYEGYYELSNFFRIKSLKRVVKNRGNINMIVKEKIISQSKNIKSEHLYVSLNKNGITEVLGIHVIVARTHIENIHNLPLVEHLNDIPNDNRPENLMWSTYSKNTKHAYDRGRIKLITGEKNKQSKLTEKDVLKIRASSLSIQELINIYNVKKTCIYNILRRNTWKHI